MYRATDKDFKLFERRLRHMVGLSYTLALFQARYAYCNILQASQKPAYTYLHKLWRDSSISDRTLNSNLGAMRVKSDVFLVRDEKRAQWGICW